MVVKSTFTHDIFTHSIYLFGYFNLFFVVLLCFSFSIAGKTAWRVGKDAFDIKTKLAKLIAAANRQAELAVSFKW